ncbi:hypothetical protein OG226_02255 [Streptomyces sp. NBC_01261]|uniref:hypothetical protein n=1 Tax=Streptomyces sp. NBC_01261 TaxID=2903802 RepID=UPI002E3783EA|nr:hypothetical protein [Streptomyces sp. NBC_01261]
MTTNTAAAVVESVADGVEQALGLTSGASPSRGERLDLAHRLIGSVLDGTAAGGETR